MSSNRLMPVPKPLEKLTSMIETIADRRYGNQTFHDFLEMSALALSNSSDHAHYDEREARYMAIIKKYTVLKDRLMFPEMLAELAVALHRTNEDVLGPISSALGLTSYRRGQYWTPWDVCVLLSKINLGDRARVDEIINKKGFITVQEPACGTGTMVLAFAEVLSALGYTPQKHMHVVAIDSAPWCVHMTYCQLALRDIPAVVILGDTLRMQMSEYWYTPRHMHDRWNSRLRAVDAWTEASEKDMTVDAPVVPDQLSMAPALLPG